MKVIYGIGKDKKHFKNTVLAIGVFDGLHLGHQKLIKAAVNKARSLGGPAIVMTFSPHPVQVLHPGDYLPFILPLPHRLKLIAALGVTSCVIVRFTKKFSQLTARRFIKRYLVDRIRPTEIFVGKDFRFGKDRGGTIEYFQEAGRQYGFHVNAVSAVKRGQSKIGSSRIRRLITDGKLYAAKQLLGRPVSVMGKVAQGDGRGERLGFPTANIYPQNSLIPPIGVYAVFVVIGRKRYKGMANVGRRPSFIKTGSHINIEVHIFQFKRLLYSKEIMIEFIKKIRHEKTFDTAEKLVAQLKRDAKKSKAILRNF